MFNDARLLKMNALMLQWHSGVHLIGFDAFQAWALAAWKPQLRFDGAIWALLADDGAAAGSRINSAHLQGLAPAVLEDFERVVGSHLNDRRAAGHVWNLNTLDSEGKGDAHLARREHALQFGLTHSLLTRFVDSHAPGRQFLLLSRKAAAHHFTHVEAAEFELLAPHLMQAYASRRKLFVERPQHSEKQLAGHAIVDRAGYVHEQHARFVPIVCREWTGWAGKRLPAPLLELTARRAGTRWQFRGEQIVADFVPVDDLYLVTARPRHGSDALTPREGEVAKRYVAGGNFREIAESLQVAPATVRSHLRNVFGKLKVRNKAQLAAIFH